MDKFDDEIASLVKEYREVSKAIERCRDQKKQCDEGIKIASKYIGEIKGQILELMGSNGVIATEVGDYLVTKKKVAPSIIIDDIEMLPEQYVKVEVSPKKLELTKALKQGHVIQGVSFGEAGETIQIRGKS